MKKIVIAAGGTGGHIIPAMTLGDELQKDPAVEIEYLGVALSENRFFDKTGRIYADVEGANFSKGFFAGLKKIFRGFWQARKRLKSAQVCRVIGFGSFHSLPVVLAAWSLGIPFDIVELNTLPGKINRLFSRWAERVFIHFDPSKKLLKGKPTFINYALKDKKIETTKKEAIAAFGLEQGVRTFLVFGGSQGAQKISEAWFEASLKFEEKFQVIHVTHDIERALTFYRKHKIRAFVTSFIKEMDLAYCAADLAICRAGAGAIREMLIYECPAILVPFPKALDQHQDYNAHFMQDEVGGALYLKESRLEEKLLTHLEEIFSEGEKKHRLMRECLSQYKAREKRESLAECIRKVL